MYSDRTEENIKKNIMSRIPNNTDKSEKGFIDNAITPGAMEFANVYLELSDIVDKLDIENLSDEELDRFIYQRTGNVTRKPATKSTTVVNIQGQEGAKISQGDFVGADTVSFVSTEDRIIGPSGETTVTVECEMAGIMGNVPAGAIRYFPVSIPGLTSVTNPEPVTNGYNAESDYDLRQRYYKRARTPATSGNKYHYLNWAEEVVGVGDAKVEPLWQGDNTVKVIIIDSNKQPASAELVAQVQDYIDPGITGLGEGQAPMGSFCTVVSGTGKVIDIAFTVNKDSSYTLEQIKVNIENNIIEYLKDIAFKDDPISKIRMPVSYAKIGAIILDSEGVLDYEDLIINGGTSNIVIADDEVAVIGEVVINE